MSAVRDATLADLDAISALERTVFGLQAWSPRSVEQELRAVSPDRVVVVAVTAEQVVGHAVLSVAGESSDLRRIAVADDFQRQGVATQLMVVLLARARGQGCRRVLLEVAEGNMSALLLYRRHGFSEISRRRRYYEDGGDALVMQLHLGGCR